MQTEIDGFGSEIAAAAGQVVRAFATGELEPHVDALEAGREQPYDLMKALGEALGLAPFAEGLVEAANRPKEPGEKPAIHAGGDPSVLATVMKELTRVSPGFALSFGASIGLCGQTLLMQGTPEQRLRWAKPVLGLEKIGCWGLTEPESGSDAFSLKTTAKKVDGGWSLTGSKTFITNAPGADVLVVYARLETTGRIAGFVLERGMPGLSVSTPFDKMGMRASPTGAIFMDDVRVTREHLLGGNEEGAGRRGVVGTLLSERIALGAMALGIVERALELATNYAKERHQFGQPIAQFQAVQLKLARIYAARETIRALVERGLRLIRKGQPDLAFFCASKLTCSESATQAALDAVQVLGGYGYMREYRVEMLARDAKLLEIGGGTSDIQLLNVARELLK
jgi:alkylation response protein AidB-like acyl-CoA dehydrogenase